MIIVTKRDDDDDDDDDDDIFAAVQPDSTNTLIVNLNILILTF